MKTLKNKVKTEVKRRMKMYSGDCIVIHKETAKHIVKVLKERIK